MIVRVRAQRATDWNDTRLNYEAGARQQIVSLATNSVARQEVDEVVDSEALITRAGA